VAQTPIWAAARPAAVAHRAPGPVLDPMAAKGESIRHLYFRGSLIEVDWSVWARQPTTKISCRTRRIRSLRFTVQENALRMAATTFTRRSPCSTGCETSGVLQRCTLPGPAPAPTAAQCFLPSRRPWPVDELRCSPVQSTPYCFAPLPRPTAGATQGSSSSRTHQPPQRPPDVRPFRIRQPAVRVPIRVCQLL